MTERHLYNFGISQEDERTEAAALGLDGGSRVLSICSAGEMPLSLLALGAGSVDAVDINESQLHLAWLKRAATLTLERGEAIRLLGYLPARPAARRSWLKRTSRELPPATRAFWSEHGAAVEAGVIWAGRYERYVRRLVRLLRLPLGRSLDRLMSCTSLEQQREQFAASFDRRWLRAVFRLAFHPRVYAHRGMDPRSLQHVRRSTSVGSQFFERFRSLCTATPVGENHLLQLHLMGRVRSEETVPAYLTAPGQRRVRDHVDRLTLRRCDLHDALRRGGPGAYNAFHLSNLPDWMSAAGFDRTMQLLDQHGRPGRAIWRFLHIDRPVPDGLALHADRAMGARLQAVDRFPLYGVVPARIGEKTTP